MFRIGQENGVGEFIGKNYNKKILNHNKINDLLLIRSWSFNDHFVI